jgi:hypothetical protein
MTWGKRRWGCKTAGSSAGELVGIELGREERREGGIEE